MDVILKGGDDSAADNAEAIPSPRRMSFPVTPPDQPGERARQAAQRTTRCDFVDMLVNAVEGEARGSGSVSVKAEDLSALISSARPFAKEDARLMCVLYQELLKRLAAGTLKIVGERAERLAARGGALGVPGGERRAEGAARGSDQRHRGEAAARRRALGGRAQGPWDAPGGARPAREGEGEGATGVPDKTA